MSKNSGIKKVTFQSKCALPSHGAGEIALTLRFLRPNSIRIANMINSLTPDEIRDARKNFLNAGPFPHVVIDNFLKKDVFEALNQEMTAYYDTNQKKGKTWNSDVEAGKWGSTGLQIPPRLKELDNYLKSPELIAFLHDVSGFQNLKVTADINGVGFSFFHAMKPGAYLGPHTDHTRDLNDGPYHVLNIIIYMSETWDANWGGSTTLFTKGVQLGADVEYRPNRALIFMHSPWSIHGTQKISELAKRQRFSIYYDYYTSDSSPYKQIGLDVKLLNSPHLFYLPKLTDYIRKPNHRYARMHLSHWKQRVLNVFKPNSE